MGCDGGSIPRRDEMVKTKKQEVVVVDSENHQVCCLSKAPLRQPIVSDALGKLYNKDAILSLLLKQQEFGDADVICPHIQSLKDIVTLKLEEKAVESSSAIHSTTAQKGNEKHFICPITSKEFNGKVKFAYAPCGCVFAEQALQVMDGICLTCSAPFDSSDIVLINPSTDEEKSLAQSRLAARKSLEVERKRLKKSEKKKRDPELLNTSGSSDEDKREKRKRKLEHQEDLKKKKVSINMTMPDLSSLDRPVSATIQSLYSKKDKDGNVERQKMSYLVSGTFNRYGGTF